MPQPVGRFDPASGQWQLVAPWSIATRVGRLHLRPGYVSDGASIPRPLWPLVGPRYAADSFAATLAHDALYDAQLTRRSLADAVLRDLLAALGMAAPRRWAYWAAVRVFGGPLWNAHSQERVEEARKYVSLAGQRTASRQAQLIKAAAQRFWGCPRLQNGRSIWSRLTAGADASSQAIVASIGTPVTYDENSAAGIAPSVGRLSFVYPNKLNEGPHDH